MRVHSKNRSARASALGLRTKPALAGNDLAACPAMISPPKRLYVNAPLAEGAQIDLDHLQANYVRNVLRLSGRRRDSRVQWPRRRMADSYHVFAPQTGHASVSGR